MVSNYEKLFISLKYYLVGKEFFTALKALEFSRSFYGDDKRKDGKTMSFSHPIEIALFITTLKNVQDEQLCITAALTHDLLEDYPVTRADIESRFGNDVADVVWKLTKKHAGKEKDLKIYFEDLCSCPHASLVKGCDRINNVGSMVGVFSKEKQKKYLKEVEDNFLPMIKKAKANFPEQSAAYFNIQNMLKSQLSLVKASLEQ